MSFLREYALGIVGLVWAVSIACAAYLGFDYGEASEIASRTSLDEVARVAREASQKGAAESIANLGVRYVPVQQKLQKQVRENVVYSNCKHPPDGLRDLNAALTRGQSASSGELPKEPGAAAGR